jgi:thrombospondin type 3 repeat protein
VRTFLRVHAIPSIMDFYDYSPAAFDMRYHNNLNLGGVRIDGEPESLVTGAVTWELVNGAQGAVVISHSSSTDIPGFSPTSYYLDDLTPPVSQCTGDAFAYGSSGQWVNQSIPNTDPATGATNHLDTVRTLYYLPPGQTVADAQARDAETQAPLTFAVSTWSADADGDTIADVADNCPVTPNAAQSDGDADALGDACEASPYGTNPADRDSDDDGCADGREVRTLTYAPAAGGSRNPLLSSDFYDVNATNKVDAADIGLVRGHFNGDGPTPVGDLIYDRSGGLAPWAPGPANNVINAVDIALVRASFWHNCQPPP